MSRSVICNVGLVSMAGYNLGTFSGDRRPVSLQGERVCGVKEGKDTCDSVLSRHECVLQK